MVNNTWLRYIQLGEVNSDESIEVKLLEKNKCIQESVI